MNSMEQSFLHSIAAAPDDDGPRLVLADWLEERGQNGDAERANFIRESIRWPHASFARLTSAADPFPLLGLTPGEPQEVFGWDDDGKPATVYRTWMWGETDEMGCVIQDLGRRMDYKVDRGFVSAVRCPCSAWLAHAAAIIEAVPMLGEVRLSDKEPEERIYWDSAEPVQMWRWFEDDIDTRRTYVDPLYNAVLPPSLFSYLHRKRCFVGQLSHLRWLFDTREHAIQALSEICLLYARDQLTMVINP